MQLNLVLVEYALFSICLKR